MIEILNKIKDEYCQMMDLEYHSQEYKNLKAFYKFLSAKLKLESRKEKKLEQSKQSPLLDNIERLKFEKDKIENENVLLKISLSQSKIEIERLKKILSQNKKETLNKPKIEEKKQENKPLVKIEEGELYTIEY